VSRFVLDTNVFIEAHQRYYPFDVCPGFWRALIHQHEAARVFSIDRVKKELNDGKDRLSDWANDRAPKGFFKQTADRAVIECFQTMVTQVSGEDQYLEVAKRDFAAVADGWLVAYAKENGLTVVTQEVYDPGAKKKVPIPNLCELYGVQCINTFAMLRTLEIKLVLRKCK
jgi:Domain of unknown function (DUF4411)